MKRNADIAIIGMSGIFPGAGDLNAFWENIRAGVDAIETVPESRMGSLFFQENEQTSAHSVDRFYCRRGGFIDNYAEFDPIQFGILPLAVEGTEPEQLLALSLAHKALLDARAFSNGCRSNGANFAKTGIIIGKGNYTGPGATRAIEIVRTSQQIVEVLQSILPDLKSEDLEKIKSEFQQKKGRFSADTAMGLIPNLTASLVANRLDLGGTAYTLDAACASSLLAIDHAVQELNSGRADMMIAGGVHACQNAPFWSIFHQLGALSKNQQIRPFDQRADGLLIGEGCGFVVLKRLSDALANGDRIYAVVQGVGVSSDGAGASVMSPTVHGQVKAIRQAWEMAGIGTDQIGYLEAHGTGTPLGDKTELETLATVFGNAGTKAGIGSVKSMIGHAMPAAGIAGIIKTVLALYHGQLPPTLHCEEPVEALADTRFEPVKQLTDWRQSGLPRYAGVNAFGFGGINAHVVLEGWDKSPKNSASSAANTTANVAARDEVLLLARPTHEALLAALETGEKETGSGNYRVAIFEPTPERIAKAVKIVTKNNVWRNKQDIWYTHEPLLANGGKTAFLFPGLDGLAGGEIDSVAEYFNLPRFEAGESSDEQSVFNTAMKLLEKSRILDSAIKKLGVKSDMNAGHSLGEWLAGRSSGLASEASVLQLLTRLNPELFEVKNTKFLAVGCGYDQLKPWLEGKQDIYLSIDNCPQQVILCGTIEAVEDFSAILRAHQIFHQQLPFQSGFHSPFVKDKLDRILDGLETMEFQPTSIPLWSATTLDIYPESFDEIRSLSVEHLVKPVRFRELIDKLYAQDVRMFVQVGSGGLVGFVDDTLKGKPYSAIASNVPIRGGLQQLQRVMAALFVEGKDIDLAFMGIETQQPPRRKPMKLQLGSPFVTELDSLKKITFSQPKKELALDDVAHPVMKALSANMDEIALVQAELAGLFRNRPAVTPPARNVAQPTARLGAQPDVFRQPGELRPPFKKPLDISLQNSPWLIDHSLLKQKPNWHCVEDMDPVIPMTMIFEVFGDIAREQAPELHVQKIMAIKVFQWMNVVEPFRETVAGEWKSPDRVYLDLDKYANAEVQLSQTKGTPETNGYDIGGSLGITITPEQIYRENMFHGPAYQGIREVVSVAQHGITGLISGDAGKGSLLDNAGQLFGLWLQLTLTKDRIAFPVKINEVEFYGEMEDQAGIFECTCRLTELTDETATADFILKREGKVWAIIRGWQNRRLEIDDKLWNVSMAPLQNVLSDEVAPGVFLFRNAYQRVVSWDFILKRYFNQPEKRHQRSLMPNKKKEWMISRVAAKDATRMLLLRSRKEAYFPIEFEIRSDGVGKPFLDGPMTGGIHISLAHKNLEAVAIASEKGPVGIDIEEIQPRSPGFTEIVFTSAELALLAGRDQDEWMTRCWVAKEAFGKMLGKGLMGNPRAYQIEEIDGDALRIQDTWINTIKHFNYIIGWTN
ncbi:3-oxoacyl-(acyl-carrier-protein) synthase/phosphopantetheinyl transferase/malonyl CoA-acyl carrier protein transacylase [Dyadobacter sp. BE34]|uniref:3-oxoacyl-(Acyl-carrier-protein) synthase/phosphopantetheinyl transferase/malonyl CoA-acyl carrier protein transacylase n=1 Tax=Dyadobacter fermentans TaxID=94254 RepID=A0ABU1R6H6_9BACT|nr:MULTISPECIES: beta-ketoacyl synthase N-terminal-like domain-containing protein [Dyadobacter]MDR6808550.1 3-oxoacyl-(acyl-carrier-protein) synthase/phosphopantetheinyl transferase/malonyl CoA-acyl carrier protein transacylase [Dyadobacter fermentans]MDR7046293.1 3-oxoacyl-(acyl-carrier-protein) synthase/phosphopantetheinyl transferase/malonyl CoA-acyl carrier protein transacylase [Dyadobacter sp. BE242]MDR7200606.1 3-oxoacyl-(acyl-carrier-protein) synthase/phosphopantetheinyl transferase/malon